jgi:hypothetical protein
MANENIGQIYEINWSVYSQSSTDIQSTAREKGIKPNGAFWQKVSLNKLAFGLEAHNLVKRAFNATDAWKIEQTGIESTVGSAKMTKQLLMELLDNSDEKYAEGQRVTCIIKGVSKKYAKNLKNYALLLHEYDSIVNIRFTDLPYEIYKEWEKKSK